jgi:hypothetical protein
MNRVYTYIAMLVLVVFLPLTAQALTLEWTRNTETDMKDYGVYSCSTVGCTVVVSPATQVATVPQPLVGVVPSWPIPAGTQGRIGVTARDTSLNESALSVTIPFDAVAPSIPVNPVLK